jgi:hypothetical protein
VKTPALKITDKDGNPAPEVKVSIESAEEERMAEQLDIGFTKLLGRAQPALKHTARPTCLKPGKAYRFTAGDTEWNWWGEPQEFKAAWENPLPAFPGQVGDWLSGMLGIMRIWQVNAQWQRDAASG